MLQGNRVIKRVEQVMVQILGNLASLLERGQIARDGEFHRIQEVDRWLHDLRMEPGYDCSYLRQPMGRLEQGDLSFPDMLEKRQGSVGILLCSRRRKNPLHHYTGVDDRLQGRPTLRALAISAFETGRCFRRKSSNASIAAA